MKRPFNGIGLLLLTLTPTKWAVQFGVFAGKVFDGVAERRDNKQHQSKKGTDGDDDEYGRIGHGAFDLLADS